jgi:hypothetical protein
LLLSKSQKNLIESEKQNVSGWNWKKMSLKKIQANPGELCKLKLISQTCNSLNYRLRPNQEAQHLQD